MKSILLLMPVILFFACTGTQNENNESNTRDLTYFLQRLRTLDHLPDLEASHTALSSTWDTNGLNSDGNYFKDLRDTVNVLLDKDGPGCIHRARIWFIRAWFIMVISWEKTAFGKTVSTRNNFTGS